MHEAGFVDAASAEAFDKKLEAVQAVWDEREMAVNPSRTPIFFYWFLLKIHAFACKSRGRPWKSSISFLHEYL